VEKYLEGAMIRKSVGEYPPDWAEIARQVKDDAGWQCVRCQHVHDTANGFMLTVHHLDMNPANCAWWNLVALCQRCHLQIQHKVVLERMWMFEHSEWFKPYVAGYYASVAGRPTDRDYVHEHVDELLKLGRAWL
jgi:5-methylcytosine-specific restriction endonuclease McrA